MDAVPARVAFFLPHLRHGGVERIVVLLLQNLDRRLFSPILILQRLEGEYLETLDDGIEVIGLRAPRPPVCIFELARILRTRRVDVVCTATNAANIYATLAAALVGSRVRAVIGEHTPLAENLAEAKLPLLREAAMRWSYRRAQLAVAPIAEIGAELRAMLGASCPPFRCLPNPVVGALAPPRVQALRARHIVSVGRLAAVKRFDLLIEVFALFRRRVPDASLTIVGEGSERPALQALVERLGLAGAVALPGYTEDVGRVLAQADIFLCTSRREGFGNAIVEAMAASVPVLSVDCPFGPAILLQGGAAGRLVTSSEPEALASALEALAADRDQRTRYAEAGRRIAKSFTVTRSLEAYSEALLAVLHDDLRAPRAIHETL